MGWKDDIVSALLKRLGRQSKSQIVQDLAESGPAREIAKQIASSPVAREIALEVGRETAHLAREKVRSEARKLVQPLAAEIEARRQRKEREARNAELRAEEQRREREIDEELEALKRKLRQS